MRYTLRLLTLDQLGRAATLICALELERRKNPTARALAVRDRPVGRPGGDAEPDGEEGRQRPVLGTRQDHRLQEQHAQAVADPAGGLPLVRHEVHARFVRAACRTRISRRDLRVSCVNRRCAFTGDLPLPILAVDEPIYRRLPCFLIATVDKFASLPWVGRTGALFGKVDRHDADGFYGPCDPGVGRRSRRRCCRRT